MPQLHLGASVHLIILRAHVFLHRELLIDLMVSTCLSCALQHSQRTALETRPHLHVSRSSGRRVHPWRYNSVWLTHLLRFKTCLACCRWRRWKNRLEDGVSLIVLFLCFWSIYSDRDSLADDLLLRVTPLQSIILLVVACTFLFELGLMVVRPHHQIDRDFLAHHLFGLAGIWYQLHYNIGGGMMIRLLLDVTTDFAQAGRTYLNLRRMGAGEVPFLVVFILVRLVSRRGVRESRSSKTHAVAPRTMEFAHSLLCCLCAVLVSFRAALRTPLLLHSAVRSFASTNGRCMADPDNHLVHLLLLLSLELVRKGDRHHAMANQRNHNQAAVAFRRL
jgi:hypothetical protein